MNTDTDTDTAPSGLRGGTYESDDDVIALLQYGTHSIHELRRNISTMGSAGNQDIVVHGRFISGS